jgi:hypothetical protein
MPGWSELPEFGFGQGTQPPVDDLDRQIDPEDHDYEASRAVGHDTHEPDGTGGPFSFLDHLHFGSGAGDPGGAAEATELFGRATAPEDGDDGGGAHAPGLLRAALAPDFDPGAGAHPIDHAPAGVDHDHDGSGEVARDLFSHDHDHDHDGAGQAHGLADLGQDGIDHVDHSPHQLDALHQDIHGDEHGILGLGGAHDPVDDHDSGHGIHHDDPSHDVTDHHGFFGI